MRHDPWRLDPTAYTERVDVEPRWADVDTLRHLNNSALHGLHQEARVRFLAARIGHGFWRDRGPRLLAQRVGTDFLLESQYPQPLQAGVRVVALDGRRLVLASALFQGGRCVGLQAAQLGAAQRGQPQPLPLDWLHALQAPLPPPLADSRWAAPAQPVLAAFAHRRALDPRYADLDATGRVSETAWMRCAEQGRSALLRAAFAKLEVNVERTWQSLLVARVDLHLLLHGAAPARWQLGAGVTHLGRSSAVLRVAFFDAAQTCHAYADCVLVFADRQAGKPVAMPETVRKVLGDLLVQESAVDGTGQRQPADSMGP
ncbi:MAG: hypothetical protein RJA10_2757 [Pseudomonadota bacterium]|jgi:acyl-CoA thioester hydrolase